jgi:hypothetical protein
MRVRRLLWELDEAVVVAYLFVIAFGAVRPFEITAITAAVAVLLSLLVVHLTVS